MADFLTEWREALISANPSWSMFLGKLPDDVVPAFMASELGSNSSRDDPTEILRFRVIARGADRQAGLDLANAVFEYCRSAPTGNGTGVDLTSWHIFGIFPSRPQQIGLNEQGRPMFSFDVEAIVRPIS